MNIKQLRIAPCLALVVLAPAARSQQLPPSPDSTHIDFSGVLFANFQYRGDKGPLKASNKFDLERVYLTFRMPAGQHLSVRFTADVFQQPTAGSDAFYKGWVLRAKYAYLQYDYLNKGGFRSLARFGILQTVLIDHEEGFWPRWLSLVPSERAGFFSSADAGVANLVTFPGRWGELYVTITNGPGYTSRETDRFKDFAARLSITPFAAATGTLESTAALTLWGYKGTLGSKFTGPDSGQLGSISSGMHRDRLGVFAGLKDPRLTIGGEYSWRRDGGESGSNSVAAPRVVTDSTGRLTAVFAYVKPFLLVRDSSAMPLGLVARWDRFRPSSRSRASYNVVIAGLTWDLSPRVALSLDYQEQTPHDGITVPTTKTYFMHFLANF